VTWPVSQFDLVAFLYNISCMFLVMSFDVYPCELIEEMCCSYAENWPRILLFLERHQSLYMELVNLCSSQTWYAFQNALIVCFLGVNNIVHFCFGPALFCGVIDCKGIPSLPLLFGR
jgi:hypothetical protein